MMQKKNMEKYYKERFEALRHLVQETAPLMDVNEIIEKVREELRKLIPNAMEEGSSSMQKDIGR